MSIVNRRITLASMPVDLPDVSDFLLVFAPLPTPEEGEVVVRTVYLSLDPWQADPVDRAELHAPPVAVGEVLSGGAVGLVVESRDPRFRIGDTVEGILGWQEYTVAAGDALRKVDSALAPISAALGVLGLPGLTAYFGMLDICRPQRGETVVVSGAAGAIGMVAGQIARIRGCRVVGVAKSDVAIDWLVDELGFDAALGYDSAAELDGELERLCPDGVDAYFDNVGGNLTDAVMRSLNPGARIAVCGQLSRFDVEESGSGPRWWGHLIVTQAKVQGFRVSAYAERYDEGLERLLRWLQQGELSYREQIAQGIEAVPQAFIGMLQGRNQGKQLVQISAADPLPKRRTRRFRRIGAATRAGEETDMTGDVPLDPPALTGLGGRAEATATGAARV